MWSLEDLAIFAPSSPARTDSCRLSAPSTPPQSSSRMFKADEIKALVNKRLSAAAEEIFSIFAQTLKEYEEVVLRSQQEVERRRRMGWTGNHLQQPGRA